MHGAARTAGSARNVFVYCISSDAVAASHQRQPADHSSEIARSEPDNASPFERRIESVLHEHVGLRITLFTITVALLIGNAWLIRRVWRLSGLTNR